MAYSTDRLARVRDFMRAVGDRVLEPDDLGFVPLADQRADDVVHDIATEIDLRDLHERGERGAVCLLTGQAGTGKSTALMRLKRSVENQGATAFYVDLSLLLPMDQPIEISDFLMAVAGDVSEQLARELGSSPGKIGYWDRVKSFLETRVEFKELNASFGGVSIKTLLRENADFKRLLQARVRSRVPTLMSELRGFFAECVDHVRSARSFDETKVVLIVDHLERLKGSAQNEMLVYESVRDLFLRSAAYLVVPGLHIVYTVPPYLLMLAPGAATALGVTLVRELTSVRVWSKGPDREPESSGLDAMRSIVEARYRGWTDIFEPTAIDALALASGGDLRQFLRLIKVCLLTAVRDDMAWPLGSMAARDVEWKMGSQMADLAQEHMAWLQQIKHSNRHCLERQSDLPKLAHLLDNQLVIRYRNGKTWYDVHPLLRNFV